MKNKKCIPKHNFCRYDKNMWICSACGYVTTDKEKVQEFLINLNRYVKEKYPNLHEIQSDKEAKKIFHKIIKEAKELF